MKIQMIAPDKVIPYARNPRVNEHAIDKVAASLKEFGWKQPIVVDKEMVIIVGHVRHQAAKRLEMAEVPVVVAEDLTPEQVKAYRIVKHTPELIEALFMAHEQGTETLTQTGTALSKVGIDITPAATRKESTHDE